LAFPLAAIYHTQSKFEKGLPVLKFLYSHKLELSKEKFQLTLIKLEEEYREMNNIGDALKIRNERVENKLINTYWELYVDCGLFMNAITDFKMFEPLPKTFNIQKFKYYSNLANLYLLESEPDSIIKYASIGLTELRTASKSDSYDKTVSGVDTIHWHAVYTEQIAKAAILNGRFREAITLLKQCISMHKSEYNKVSPWLSLSQCLIAEKNMQKQNPYSIVSIAI